MGLDPMKALSLINLNFDDFGRAFLWEMYDVARDNALENKEARETLVTFYQNLIHTICHSYLEIDQA